MFHIPRHLAPPLILRFRCPESHPTTAVFRQDVGYTGETAEYFQLFHVTSRIERFEAELEQRKASNSAAAAPAATPDKADKSKGSAKESEEVVAVADPVAGGGLVKDLFPFHGFFANAPAGDKLFGGKDLEEDLEVARGCFRHISKVGQGLLLLLLLRKKSGVNK